MAAGRSPRRRELEAARETLRRELGHEPSLSDLAAKVGTDEKRLGRTIVRIHTIESTSPLATSETVDEACLPTALVPSEPEAPDAAYERSEMQDKVRAAIGSLPPREQKVITLYYYGDVTMKQIGAEIGVNESRVSQLHARAIKRLRVVLADMAPAEAMSALKSAVLAFHQKPVMAKATLQRPAAAVAVPAAVAAKARGRRRHRGRTTEEIRCRARHPAHVECGGGGGADKSSAGRAEGPVAYVDGLSLLHVRISRAVRRRSPSLNGLASQRHPLSWRNRSASVPATSPVTNMTRRAAFGVQRGQLLKESDAVDLRHLQVTHDQVVRLGGDAAERLFAVAGAIDHEPGVDQRLCDRGRECRLIFNDQDSRPCQRVEVGLLRRQ